MGIGYYQDVWRYTDPYGTVYNQEAFQDYLNKTHPPKYPFDYSTQANAERELIDKGGWKKEFVKPKKPDLKDVAGKYLLVSQHAEPRAYTWDNSKPNGGYWTIFNYKDLEQQWWDGARPDIVDQVQISWGRSCWLIGHDGTLTFSGADYDSSD